MSTTTHAERLAQQLESVTTELIETVEGCTDEQLRLTTAREQWPVVVVAHHLAVTYGALAEIFAGLAADESSRLEFTADQINEGNAQHAREYANVEKQETLDLLRANRPTFLAQIRNLDDQGLYRTAGIVGGNEVTMLQMIEGAGIYHTADHLESIRETIAA
jgi:hypothetical protein